MQYILYVRYGIVRKISKFGKRTPEFRCKCKKQTGSDDRSFYWYPQASIAALDKVALITMSTANFSIQWKACIILLSVLLLFGETPELFSEAKGCVSGSPKRRLSFVNPTCRLGPVLIRGGDLSEDEFEDDHLDDPIGNEIISSFHEELQRIRSEMVAEAIREMDLLRVELLRKKQERRNRRLSLRQSSDGFNSDYDEGSAIKVGVAESNGDVVTDDDSIKTDSNEQIIETDHEETTSNDMQNVDTEEFVEEAKYNDEFEGEFDESQHDTMQENHGSAGEVTNSDFVMGDTDEYDSDVLNKLDNEDKSELDEEQQSHDELNHSNLHNEIIEESQDDETHIDEYTEENQSGVFSHVDESHSEQGIENLKETSVTENTMQGYTDDSEIEVATKQLKLEKKKKTRKKTKSKKKQKKGKKKRKNKKTTIEKLSTKTIAKPTTTLAQLQQPSSSNKVRSKSVKQELIKILLFVAAFVLSQITMGFILRMLKSTDE